MKMKQNFLIRLLTILWLSIIVMCKSPPNSGATFQVLTILDNPKSYNKAVIPYENTTGPMIVETSFFIRSFKIDDVKGIATVDLTLRLYWRDKRLKYSSVTYPAEPIAESTRLTDTSSFWIPDAFFRNSFKTEKMESVYPEAFIEVAKNGNIMYSCRFILHFNCPMNLKRFPHDSQECKLFLSSYAHTTKEIMFVYIAKAAISQREQDSQLGQKLILSGITKGYCESKTLTGGYPCLKLTFQLDRVFHYYLIEFYIPCASLVILAFFSEILEASAILPRLILTVCPMLALGTLCMYYSQTVPKVPYVTALDLFSGVSLSVIQITVLYTLISYYFSRQQHEVEDTENEITKWQLFYKRIKKLLTVITKILLIGSYFIFVYFYLDKYDVFKD